MRILALQGSPRAEGNTQTLLDIILQEARESGAATETVQLVNLEDLTGCTECYNCQHETDSPGCVIDDGMQRVLDKALEADVIIWATPVFCWSPAWPLKIAMDRFYCMFKFNEQHGVNCLLRGRTMAAVITAGGGKDDGADLVEETCRRLARFSQGHWLGAFIAEHVREPDDVATNPARIEAARAFGRRLAGK